MKYIEGDLIKLAKEGNFDIIAHGCNCFCTMGGGIARQISQDIPEAYEADKKTLSGDIGKLGNYTIAETYDNKQKVFAVFNCYTQYYYGGEKPFDYEAFILCMRKINYQCHGQRIGLPLIGAGLAGGDWNIIEKIIENELKDMDVTVVKFKKI